MYCACMYMVYPSNQTAVAAPARWINFGYYPENSVLQLLTLVASILEIDTEIPAANTSYGTEPVVRR